MTFVTTDEHPTFPTANLMIRRSVFEGLGGFDEALSFRDPFDRATECADTDLAWRALKAGHARRFIKEAIVWHEIEDFNVVQWILEPTRLFLLPALVRRHPELRTALLTARFIFYPPILLFYLALAIALVAAAWSPWLLLALPLMLLIRAVQRTQTIRPVLLARHATRVLAHLPRMLVMTLALLYGSIRFRALVL